MQRENLEVSLFILFFFCLRWVLMSPETQLRIWVQIWVGLLVVRVGYGVRRGFWWCDGWVRRGFWLVGFGKFLLETLIFVLRISGEKMDMTLDLLS
jgi:hypothetical protein